MTALWAAFSFASWVDYALWSVGVALLAAAGHRLMLAIARTVLLALGVVQAEQFVAWLARLAGYRRGWEQGRFLWWPR